MARSLGLGLVCFALLVAAATATQFRVGGQRGWSVPDANAESYNAWAGRMRFQIGDQLLFVYPKGTDSVLLVEPAAYNACNTSSYVSKFDDGNTVFTLDRSGPFFFVSGNEANCRANQKLIVVVLADRSGTRTPPPPSSAPLPSPTSSPPAPVPVPTPPSAAPMPAPATTPSSSPPAPAPVPVPTPPSAAPMPAPATTPSSAPPPGGSAPASAPTTTPESSPPSPAAPTPSSSTPGGAPQPPSGSASGPTADGGSTTTPTPPSNNGQGGASTAVAAFVASLAAYISYAMLAI